MVDVILFVFRQLGAYIGILSQYYFTQALMLVCVASIAIGFIFYVVKGGKN